MRAKKFIFSKEQEQYLIDNWEHYSIHRYKKVFGCSWYSVFNKANEIGLVIREDNKWTEEEEKRLSELANKHHYREIARILNRTENAIYLKARRKGIVLIQDRREWTEEEDKFLSEKWGSISIEYLAAQMKRSVFSLKVRAIRTKLGPMTDASLKYIKVNEIAEILNVTRDIIVIRWQKEGLNLINKKLTNNYRYYVVTLDDLVLFLKNNQELWDSRYLEKFGLGFEPDWLVEKRKKDKISPPIRYRKWTEEERETAKNMLLAGSDYDQISEEINRTKAAVRVELNKMNLAYRLARYWKCKELKMLNDYYRVLTAKELSKKINRSPKAIQARAAEIGIKKKVLVKK